MKMLLRKLIAASLLLSASTATLANPICSSAATDQDGDGWGWENNQSCIVQSDTGTPAVVPACSSAAADSDGDGWGWENNDRCIVTPVCTSADVDPDGDGWGWENNNSCIVATGSTGTPPVTTDPAPTPPVMEIPVATRIMAAGDSITHGVTRGSAASYRKPFIALLEANSCQFAMTGSQTGNHFHNTFVSPHEGYSGHTADHMLNGRNDSAGNNNGIRASVGRYQPHVVLLHIGSNDMRLGQNIGETVGEIGQIISTALASDSAPMVLVANVIPWYSNAATRTSVASLGDQIETYVARLNNPRVKLVDVRTGYRPSMMLEDMVHPNSTGEKHIADRFFAVYKNAGFCG